MGNYSNIPIGLRIPTQIPLNAKENIADEATLKDLGINDNLAFTYEKGLIIYCKLEGTRYEWREVLSGEELTGLRDTDYIYPNGVITNDVDYSNKKYNFFTIENNTSNIFIEEGDNIVIDGNGSNVTPYIISGLSSPFNSVNNSYFPRNRNESQFGDIGQFSYDFSFAEIGANGEPEGQIGQNGVQPDELYGSLGNLTYTFGYNLSAQGYNDSLFGRYNHSGLQSEYSTILGRNNYNNSKNSLLSGSYNKIIYNILGNSTVFGQGNIINGAAGLTSGVSLLNKSFGTTVLGQANTDYTDTSEDINEALSPILIVGNGDIATPDGIWTSTLRSDALKLLKNGLLTLPSVTNDLIENDVTGKAVVTKEYLETVFPNTPDGSETKIIPGTNIGITGNGTTLTPYIISSNNDDISQYTNEMAQDAVGSILQNSDTIEFVYDDDNNTIHANLKGEAYRFITKTGFTLVDNVITINPLNVWLINNIEYSNPLSIELTIPYSTSGNQRIIYIVPNNTNSFDIISGEESVSIPGAPTLEFPDLYLTFYLVTDGTVGETVLPNYNDLFLKRYKLTYKTSQSDFNLEPGEDDYNVIFTGTTNSSINIFPNGSYGKYIRNGAIYPFKNMGTGVVSIWSGIGVTVNAPNGLILNPNHQCYIIKDDWNEWTVINPPSDLGKEITSNKISSITGYSTTLYPNEKATHDALDLKLNISDLPTNLTLYPTTTASDVSGYVVMVKDIHDVRYNSTAVDVSTPTITGVGQLISQRISDAGVLMGQPGVFNITTFGNIRHLSGSGTATFYFEVYHRDAAGVETLICTSSTSEPVVDGGYSEFTASGLWDDGDFVATDRIVIKSYANRIAGGSDPVYQFQFGGASPVRTLLPVPFSVVDAGYELNSNKQNSLAIDGTGTKYPTVDAVNAGLPVNYSKIVYVNATSPITATIFDTENPPVTNDNLLKNDVANLYIGTDASTWVYNSTTYVTKTVPSTSNFNTFGTTVDAGSSKTSHITRSGAVTLTGPLNILNLKISSTPVTSVGSPDILTRNPSTTALEKKLVSDFLQTTGNQSSITGRKYFASTDLLSGGIGISNSKTTGGGDAYGLGIYNTGSAGIYVENTTSGTTGNAVSVANQSSTSAGINVGNFNSGTGITLRNQGGTGDLLYAELGKVTISSAGKLSTTEVPTTGNNVTNKTYVDAKITQTIINGVTDKSPSEDAVYDALANATRNIINTTSTATVTGTLTETLLYTGTIPANSLGLESMPNLRVKISKGLGGVGTMTLRVKVNSTNDFATATNLGVYIAATSANAVVFERNPTISGGNIYISNNTSSILTDISASSSANTTFPFDTTLVNYLFISIQLSDTTTDVGRLRSVKLIN